MGKRLKVGITFPAIFRKESRVFNLTTIVIMNFDVCVWRGHSVHEGCSAVPMALPTLYAGNTLLLQIMTTKNVSNPENEMYSPTPHH